MNSLEPVILNAPSQTASRLNIPFRRLPPQKVSITARGLPTSSRTRKANARTLNGKIQNFSYFAPGATSVQLAGCFTQWQNQPITLRKRADGMWWAGVRLERGTYYYRFLVDDEWRDDPECPLVVPNPFGSLNAVRQVH